jgi:hypothetical protein
MVEGGREMQPVVPGGGFTHNYPAEQSAMVDVTDDGPEPEPEPARAYRPAPPPAKRGALSSRDLRRRKFAAAFAVVAIIAAVVGVIWFLVSTGELGKRPGSRVPTTSTPFSANNGTSGDDKDDNGDSSSAPSHPPWVPLRAAADRSGLYFGNIRSKQVLNVLDPLELANYNRLIKDNFNMLTAEVACKPEVFFATGPDPPDFGPCDAFMAYAKAFNQSVRFHVAAWVSPGPCVRQSASGAGS